MTNPTDKAIEAAGDKMRERCRSVCGAWVDELPTYDFHDIMRDAIAAYERAMWRPIEEAPRASECEDVLVIGGRYAEPTVVPSDVAWWVLQNSLGNQSIPTHFRPLPAVPEGE